MTVTVSTSTEEKDTTEGLTTLGKDKSVVEEETTGDLEDSDTSKEKDGTTSGSGEGGGTREEARTAPVEKGKGGGKGDAEGAKVDGKKASESKKALESKAKQVCNITLWRECAIYFIMGCHGDGSRPPLPW